MLTRSIWSGLFLAILIACNGQGDRVNLGKLQTGVVVSFVRNMDGDWGLEIAGATISIMAAQKPVQIEVYQNQDVWDTLTAGYKSIEQQNSAVRAQTQINYNDGIKFDINDVWNVSGTTISVSRKVEVAGDDPGGFNSSIGFVIDTSLNWLDMNCFVPGALYGDPAYNTERAPGGTLNNEARHFQMREDILAAPLFALSFANGASVSMLNPSPQGASTVQETKLTDDIMTDSRFQFGSLGVWQKDGEPVKFGFQFPGSTSMYRYGPDAPKEARWIRRYHPLKNGFNHSYKTSFRFATDEPFLKMVRNSWRWAWATLKPEAEPIDVRQMRRVLTDHLFAQAATIEGRSGIPFAIATFDTSAPQWNWTMTAMGFVSKNIECADHFLREGDRDSSLRGQSMRKTGLNIIASMIRALLKIPLQASGYDLTTGKPWTGDRQEWLAPWLRNVTEGMSVLMHAYQRERKLGRLHPEWIKWVKSYVDWLLLQQREDGSFPRRWIAGSSEVAEPTGSTSYCPVPLLLIMSEETGDPKYQQSAFRAAEYVWENWTSKSLFVGGTSDNPNITDKEAGMLSLEAYLSLYESTSDSKWLERAKVAADYTESWIWIWNLPMPVDADNAHLHWKKGVPTIGLQGINARGPGGVDEYLDWSAPSYAKLYLYTKDQHYLDVARILLHATKSMVALPGRQYDMRGIGFQQEHWRLGPGRFGRGVGGHRFWLPWISSNHLHSISGLEEADADLFKQLSKGE
jgi:hypothetical protein